MLEGGLRENIDDSDEPDAQNIIMNICRIFDIPVSVL